MEHKTLIGGTSYKISDGKATVGGAVYDLENGEVRIGKTVYEVGLGIPIKDLDVGISLWFNVNNVPTEFIIVQKGIPTDANGKASSLYDASCDGVWVMMKNCHSFTECGSGNYNNYGWSSNIHTFFNNGFLNELETSVRNSIKTVKIPWVAGTGQYSVASGANGLSVRGFALSGYEVGFTQGNNSALPIDGAVLDYFKTDANRDIDVRWWLRSPVMGNTEFMWVVDENGNLGSLYCDYAYGDLLAGRRPAFILRSNFDVTDYL